MKLRLIALKKTFQVTLLRTLLTAFIFSFAASVFPAPKAVHADSPSNPIVTENNLPGTSSWLIGTPRQDQISGYFNDVSYLPGQNAGLYVNSNSDAFSYVVYRMGYYQGLGGRQITSGSVANNNAQPSSYVYNDYPKGEKLYLTNWNQSTTIPLGANWVSGYYLVKLHDNVNGGESYANFTLRSSTPAPIVINLSTNTWQAYNLWGNLDLYRDARYSPAIEDEHFVAHEVSFLRPYEDEAGAGSFFYYDNPLVSWAESMGYPVSYSTDQDVRNAREAGPDTKLVIFSGHPEYYSMPDRNELKRLTTVGVNEAFFGGNAWPTQARFDDKSHIMSVWRFASLDPETNYRLKTIHWISVGFPQNTITGEMQTWGTQTGDQTAYAASSWPWDGAGVVSGQQLGPVEGLEWDGIAVNKRTPTNLLMLSRTPFSGMPHVPAGQAMTLWQKTPDAFVFEGGQTGFNWNLSFPGDTTLANWIGGTYPTTTQIKPAIQRLVGNLIQRATSITNPVLPISPTATPDSFHIVAPQAGQYITSAPSPWSVSWSDPPDTAATVKISLDKHIVGTALPGSNVFVSAKGIPNTQIGPHTLKVIAGSVSTPEVTIKVTNNNSFFTANYHKIFIEWDNESETHSINLACNPLSLTVKALSPGAKPCWR